MANHKKIEEIFTFSDSLNSVLTENTYVITIPSELSKKADLMKAYRNSMLSISEYFGENWDALNDVLGHLDWVNNNTKNVIIFHQDIPLLENKEDLEKYIQILATKSLEWQSIKLFKDIQDLSLKVIFPVKSKELILGILQNKDIYFEGLYGLQKIKVK